MVIKASLNVVKQLNWFCYSIPSDHMGYISCRGTFSIGFHHYNEQLHHRGVEERSMLGISGLSGLAEGLTNFSRKRSGSSGLFLNQVMAEEDQ